KVVITTQPPGSVTAGGKFGLVAKVEDLGGNVETGDNSSTVTLALSSSSFASGSKTALVVSGGAADFPVSGGLLTINQSGAYTITASDGSPAKATSTSITINPGPPASITPVPGTTPQSAPVGNPFGTSLAVLVTDSGGNPISGVSVTFATANSVFANGTF